MQIISKLPTKGLHRIIRDGTLSKQAQMRLTWMDFLASGHNVAETSRHFFVAESTIRFWKKRYNPIRPKSLEDRSHRPKQVRYSPVVWRVQEQIIELRKKYKCDKVKLQCKLKKFGISVGQSRIQKIINQAGLKRQKAKRKRVKRNRTHMYAVPKEQHKRPGGLIYLDVKHLMLSGGRKAYQFTAIDHATRYLFAQSYKRIRSQETVAFLEYIQKQIPFEAIEYIGTDNGSEFLGDFEKALEEKDIPHVFSSPRSPKQNPFVERVIRTVVEEHYQRRGVAPTLEELNEKLEEYVKSYNMEREHYGIELRTPYEQLIMLQSENNSAANPQHHPN